MSNGEDRSAGASVAGFTAGWFSAYLALVLTVAFWPVLVGGESFYFRDFGVFGYPLAHYHRASVWSGELPLWNPLSSCGLPFLAQWNTMTLYPGALLYLGLPLPWSLNLFCLAHQFLGGLGMYYLARAWTGSGLGASLAGLGYALSGLMLSSLKWPNNIAVLGWLPWVVWLAEHGWREGGRAWLWATLAGAMQMLAGTPELIALTWGVVAALWVAHLVRVRSNGGAWRVCGASAGRFAGMVLLVAGLSAAQLLPFFELLSESHRDVQYGVATWAMPSWGWANFLVPLFRCFRSYQGVFAQVDQYWVASYYLGVGLVVLGLWAVACVRRGRVWLLAVVGGAGVWLALGEAGGLYGWLRAAVPWLGFMRFPIKFVVLTAWAMPLLGAFAVAECQTQPEGASGARQRLLGLLAGLLCAAIGGLLWWAAARPLATDDAPATLWNGLSRLLFLMGAVALWLGLVRARTVRRRWLLGLLLLVTSAGDLLTHVPWQNPTVPNWTLEPGLAELAPRPRSGESRAFVTAAAERRLDHWNLPTPTEDYLSSRLGLFANCNLLEGIPKVDGFFSLYPRATAQVVHLLYGSTNGHLPGLLNFLGVSHATAEGKALAWSTRLGAQPLITAGRPPVFSAPEEAVRRWAAVAPDQAVYLPPEASVEPAVESAGATVRSQRWRPHLIEFEVETERPAWVVIAQSFYPGWQAQVNGQAARLWPANVGFQALAVPAGASSVRLRYVDRWFRAGAVVSSISILAVASLAWRLRRTPQGTLREEEAVGTALR